MEKQTPESYSTLGIDAQQEFVLKDLQGLPWIADITTLPVHIGPETSWEATVTFKCKANAQELAQSQTLDSEEDARLLSIIGNRTIHFTTSSKKFHGRSEEHVKRLAFAAKTQFQKEIENPKHLQRKRSVISAWVDRWHQFG